MSVASAPHTWKHQLYKTPHTPFVPWKPLGGVLSGSLSYGFLVQIVQYTACTSCTYIVLL